MKRAIWLAGISILSAGAVQAEDLNLTVYMRGAALVEGLTMMSAKATTTKIFVGIGVRIRWEQGSLRISDGPAILMQFDESAPARFQPEALGYAKPFDPFHTEIHILYTRVLRSVPREVAPALLGHVMSHEIAHVLERLDRHSATGVMKANWVTSDYDAMAKRPLTFEPGNAEAIRAYWNSNVAATRSPSVH
jgi:hypothetical protein